VDCVNWLDFVLVLVLAVSMIAGLSKGFTRTAIGFVSFILALFLGLWFYGLPAAAVREYLSSQQLANFAGFMSIFLAVMVAGALIEYGVYKFMKAVNLSWLDRLAGGAFGIIRGVLVGAALVTAFMAFAPKAPPVSVAHSRVAPYVMHTARAMVAAAPREVKDGFRNSYERVRTIWSDAVRGREASLKQGRS
jgi:membrane protein required for colicin V production